MPGMQGPGPQQGQDNERNQPLNADEQSRFDELNRKVQSGEQLTSDEQQELNRMNQGGQNPGAANDENVQPNSGGNP